MSADCMHQLTREKILLCLVRLSSNDYNCRETQMNFTRNECTHNKTLVSRDCVARVNRIAISIRDTVTINN